MIASELTETVTVRDLLYCDAAVEPTRALTDSLHQSGTVNNLVARFPGVTPLVEGEVARQTDEQLSLSLLDLAVEGWKKFDELVAAARRTRDNSAARETVKLATHKIEFSHPWTVEVFVNGRSAGTVEVELTVCFDMDLVVLVVQQGRITAVESGRCTIAGALQIAGAEVIKRQARFDLRLRISLGHGLILAGPAAVADQRLVAGR
ncbi:MULTISPECIES: hypothetical protein [unclassified Mycobacterium]|uniref:hypothetical protein n=1 Tax=unclassified Mycobacterium TaxID=2642494 RepID=UPI00048C30EE|nr:MULTISPECIES: hypothetical protein [unclassified Mycobacterium]SEA92038.1 hypothetical protein SAMN04488580_105235 [Mycobacterium sp. 283mftsu]